MCKNPPKTTVSEFIKFYASATETTFSSTLSHSEKDKGTSDFLDNIYSNSFFRTTNLQTCIKTLIYNFFYNDFCKKLKAGNIVTTTYLIISPNFQQFLVKKHQFFLLTML